MGGPKYTNRKTEGVQNPTPSITKKDTLINGIKTMAVAATIFGAVSGGIQQSTAKEIAQKVDSGKFIAQGIRTTNTFKKLEIPQTLKIQSISYEEVNAAKVQTEEWTKEKKIVVQSFKEYPYYSDQFDFEMGEVWLTYTIKAFSKVLKEWGLYYREDDLFNEVPIINGIPYGHKKPNKYVIYIFGNYTNKNRDAPLMEFLPLSIELAERKSALAGKYIDPFHFVEFCAVQRTDEPGQSILIGVDHKHLSLYIYNNKKKEIFSKSYDISVLGIKERAGLFFCPTKNEQGIEGFRITVLDKDNVRDSAGKNVFILECYPSLEDIVPYGLYQVEQPKKY